MILAESVERIKGEIREDMGSGVVPPSVAAFGDLHDYVDANEYGGFCEDGVCGRFPSHDAFIEFVDAAQGEVDAWLKS